MNEKKEKFSYWIEPSLVEEMGELLEEADAQSKGDFLRQAIRFYIGYLRQKKCLDFIAPVLAQTIRGEIGSAQENISKMLFKLAVEQSITNNLTAVQTEVEEESLAKLRGTCAEKVAELNGAISFEDAYRWQRSK
jgi:hypothetical protein